MQKTDTIIRIRHSHQKEDLEFTMSIDGKISEIMQKCEEFYKTKAQDQKLIL